MDAKARRGAAEVERASPYEPQQFAFRNLRDQSKEALSAHVGLYEAYVEQANEIAQIFTNRDAIESANPTLHARESLARRFAFEANGVRLHEWFFEQLDGDPSILAFDEASVAMEACDVALGGFEAWRSDLRQVAQTRGSGWVVALWDEGPQLLSNVWIDLHHLSIPLGQRVVYLIDLWEHAYWTDFGPKGRERYVESVIRNTDWSVVQRRFEPAAALASA